MQTLGEKRVRLDFNPTSNTVVDQIKHQTAELIDLCEQMKPGQKDPEVQRLWALAQTHYEDAAMWATKGATASEK